MGHAGQAIQVAANESKWRLLVGAAPLAGVALVVWALAQGEIDVDGWSTARVLLAAVAAIGAGVAWRTARQLRPAAALTVARAARLAQAGRLSGRVSVRGRAQALPDAAPLVSPDGELCVWFEHRVDAASPPPASVRPFLLVDHRGGRCLVIAADAEVSGRSPGAAAQQGALERVLRAGDRVVVTGRFVEASAESVALQATAAALAARSEARPGALRHGERPSHDLRAAAQSGASFAAAPQRLPGALPLPVVAAGAGLEGVQVRVGPDENEGAVYGLLALADGLVLLVVAALALQPMH
jgi:hypothetical protein